MTLLCHRGRRDRHRHHPRRRADLPSGRPSATPSARRLAMAWRALPRRCAATRSSSSTSRSSRCCSPRCSPTSSAARSPAASQSYLPIIIPGILAQTTLTACMATGIQLREDMDKGVFDRFKSLPIARIAPLAGPAIADLLRYAIAATLTILTGIAMGYRPGGGVAGVLAGWLLTVVAGWSLAWIFTWLGTMARSAQAVQGISMMIMFPLTFLSNAFVPAETLPGWLQTFVKVNPVSHIVTAVRDLMNDGQVTAQRRLGAARLRRRRRDLRCRSSVRSYSRKM